MKSTPLNDAGTVARSESRFAPYRDLSFVYEGHGKANPVRVPDISPNGMFINTTQEFAQGSVLNLEFRLPISPAVIRTRGEVRYCLPGVGIGIEFVAISPPDREAIRHQILVARGMAVPDSH